MTRFRIEAERRSGASLPDTAALHAFSVRDPGAFWAQLWDFCDVRGEPGARVFEPAETLEGARFFPDARLGFAENLLRHRGEDPALVFRNEAGAREVVSREALRRDVARAAAGLRALGVGPGDRVAAILPNRPEAVIGMLACASLGAVWSSCSPDFGPAGVVDRFSQIEPCVLFSTGAHLYGGKRFESLSKLPEILRALPSVRDCIVVPYLGGAELPDGARSWPDWLASQGDATLELARFPFGQPLYVLFSSGTTGKPKCIVHGAGGTLLQHLKEHRLHVDLAPDDCLFYFTTCGWMMWNWLVSGLATGARLLLYDGSPSHPDPAALFRIAEEEGVTVFGTSAKFLDAVAKSGVSPAREADLSKLRTLLSTGSPLSAEGFDFVYEHVASDLHLASISGGTDIVSCFVLGDPTAPVYRGEIQQAGLGMRVEVFDDEGRPLRGEPGELVCTSPFPSIPLGFWNDPDGRRFRAAYFERFPGAWHHGDWIRRTENDGWVITGRSDAVLNPGGVRIGTAEIYRAVERLDEVLESIAIGQDWQDDVRVILFVVLREDVALDDALRDRIRRAVRENASPRHVPARILAVPDIPRTRSGKITELAVRERVHGRPVRNVEALANPEALEHFAGRGELEQ